MEDNAINLHAMQDENDYIRTKLDDVSKNGN
ncbi:hypothetical protein Spaf_0631 [Streptococcus parasanguinis FW213]|uniref:Uncharacterized protein n=1 Tax=Streptococcus parasanguinis FW213 TaxID=1114965 RepID=I1ZKR5_STRPA|nr:hypothetical protein Spaf_0631 [Streptococcus parasanguinis FW213]